MSTIVRVDPQTINAYAAEVSEGLGAMASTMTSIVADVDGLNYVGANAETFKQACSETAQHYVGFMNEQLVTLAETIVAATRGIETALGGSHINFAFERVSVNTAIAGAGGDVVEIDTAAFHESKAAIEGYFDRLIDLLAQQQAAFDRTSAGWSGNARDSAEEIVKPLLSGAIDKTNETKATISTYMSDQHESAITADQGLS